MKHELWVEGEVVREAEGARAVLLVVAKLLALQRERKVVHTTHTLATPCTMSAQ